MRGLRLIGSHSSKPASDSSEINKSAWPARNGSFPRHTQFFDMFIVTEDILNNIVRRPPSPAETPKAKAVPSESPAVDATLQLRFARREGC
jgi:hypothetical protein